MGASILKLLSAEVTINSTANNISNASCLRILNTGANALITIANADADTLGTLTLLNNSEVIITKAPTDTIKANTNTGVLTTSIAFRN